MSTRRERNRKARAAAALIAEAQLSEPRVIGCIGEWELVVRGRVLFAVPQIRPEYPEDLKHALRRRRAAQLSGRCACEGHTQPGSEYGLMMIHNTGCPASDESVKALYEAAGRTPIMVPPGVFDGI
jgi:hypothetical protein